MVVADAEVTSRRGAPQATDAQMAVATSPEPPAAPTSTRGGNQSSAGSSQIPLVQWDVSLRRVVAESGRRREPGTLTTGS